MKKIKYLSFITALILVITACETKVVDPAGDRDVAPVPGIVDLNPATFDVYNLETTFVKFTVVLDDSRVSEAKVLVSYKGNKKRVEVAKVSSFPKTLEITAKDVAAKLGLQLDDVKEADVFNFEVQTVVGGDVYFSSAAFNVAVVCAYDVANVSGAYTAVSEDWGLEADVEIVVDPNDDYVLYVHGLAEGDGLVETGPLKLVVDELDFSVKAGKSVLAADTEPWDLPYTGFNYEGSGELNTCNGTYTLAITVGVDQGTWGLKNFVFTKK